MLKTNLKHSNRADLLGVVLFSISLVHMYSEYLRIDSGSVQSDHAKLGALNGVFCYFLPVYHTLKYV